ncbi:hypothetical protein GMORB2_3722 [Geosmithia morbida]|uniref:Inner kinetochore subunit AME1 domain-containing protein n=1 Tax=Geosmithia morbida TaxID=1094350 RepID=A0A9P4YXG6_9HYPO|nr:uncharacterized protein GMORB2_3722 [Geosmithia morbida]KAF4124883.1 hypothetical protein GMORB2_3722 [Geosmithia morbida]
MATGREARAERLNDRLRGAQRTNVGDESFNLDLGDLAASSSAPPSTSPQQQSSSPAKRRKTAHNAAPTSSPANHAAGEQRQPQPQRRSPRKRGTDDLPSTSKESDGAEANAASRTTRAPSVAAQRIVSTVRRERSGTPAEATAATAPGELESLPPPPSSVRSIPSARRPASIVEEIGESPENAPGSGRRTSVRPGSALASSARLQATLRSDRNTPMSSSPLVRKSRASEASASARASQATRRTPEQLPEDDIDQVDELSPAGSSAPPEGQQQQQQQQHLSPEVPKQVELPEEEEEEEEEEQAETIGEIEAARTLGTKRPRTAPSPQLGENEDQETDMREQQPSRKRGRPSKSPATQKQGKPKPATAASAPKPYPLPRPRAQPRPAPVPRPRRPRQPSTDEDDEDETQEDSIDDGAGAIALTVQRFVNHRRHGGGDDDDDADPLQLDMPFANRTQETPVDVFAQVCDEVIANTLDQFHDALDKATDAGRKKELRAKVRAVESYREVVGSRLLQHAIHLNHWHSLRKRVRHAQKEKLALREEILRLKGEREQVALRMDGVRAKHESDTKDANFLLNTSTTMRDIDLAVSHGREAPELPERQQKEAELANLELAVAQVADQVSSASPRGGLLGQLKDFNAPCSFCLWSNIIFSTMPRVSPSRSDSLDDSG